MTVTKWSPQALASSQSSIIIFSLIIASAPISSWKGD
uniref:Uncharacterized protein n=1 Tax=Anguilla anguilla TaxID=7936 RepID=A0A0E9S1D3_ANGAN